MTKRFWGSVGIDWVVGASFSCHCIGVAIINWAVCVGAGILVPTAQVLPAPCGVRLDLKRLV